MTREEAIKELKDFKDDSWDGMPEEVIDIAIKALEQEPCKDAISRQAVLDSIEDDNRNGHYSCFASNNDAQCFKDVIKALPSVTPQPKEKEFVKFNDFYPEDRGTYPPAGKEILIKIKNHKGDNFIAYLDYDDAEDGGWGFYSENGDFIADVNEIDAWMPIPQHEKDKNYIPIHERKTNDLIPNIDDPGTDEEEEIWQM